MLQSNLTILAGFELNFDIYFGEKYAQSFS